MRVPLPGRDYFPPRVLLHASRPALEMFRAGEAETRGLPVLAGQVQPGPASAAPLAPPSAEMRPATA